MNPIVHFEIPAGDMDAAKVFYERAFGWKIFTYDPAYFLARTAPTDEKRMIPSEPGAVNGALMKRRDPAERPVLVLRVDDVDAALARVEAAGGAIVLPTKDIGVGTYAQFRDPEGNVLALFKDAPQAAG